MFERINKQRKQSFKKKHFVRIIKNVVWYCTRCFGYKKEPYVFETENEPNALMVIRRSYIRKNAYIIFYDYKKFKKIFGHLDFEGQCSYAMLLIAHEMRHYFQMRQLDSKKPWVDNELLEEWRKDDEVPMFDVTNKAEQLEHFKRPMELDAELFAYWFVAEMQEVLVSTRYISENYIDEMEKHYIRLFGETDEDLFPKDENTK
ncbi:MAG: hypothetical protein IJC80_00345 [Clostridia bacterium]|nr:hypothetical protein [Clostridia bacterium]